MASQEKIYKISFRSFRQEASWLCLAMLYPFWGLFLPVLILMPTWHSMPFQPRALEAIFYLVLMYFTMTLRNRSVAFRVGAADRRPEDAQAELTPTLTAVSINKANGRNIIQLQLQYYKGSRSKKEFPLEALKPADAALLLNLMSGPETSRIFSLETRKELARLKASATKELASTIRYIPDPTSQKVLQAPATAATYILGWWNFLCTTTSLAVVPLPLAAILSLSAEAVHTGYLRQALYIGSSLLYFLPYALATVEVGTILPSGMAIGGAYMLSQNPGAQTAAICILLFLIYKLLRITFSPTAIILDGDGLKIVKRFWIWSLTSARIKWQDITAISTEHPSQSTDPAHWKIVLNGPKLPVFIELGGLLDMASKQNLLKALDKYAPTMPRDPEVYNCLQTAEEQSYTDLWLQALTQPPQRQKLLPLEPGLSLKNGEYIIQNMHAAGGQGLVYLASNGDHEEESHLIVKEAMLPLYVSEEARRKAVERFDRDARLLSELNSPHVAKVVDYFIEDHRSYLVTRRVNGEDLRSAVTADGPMDEEEILRLLPQMLACLKYIHSRTPPVVHQDFTPDNLIGNTDGRLVLIDFDVARQQSNRALATIVGKQAYTPPEQLRGQAVPASDIYAMGATLYFLATGEDPQPISRSILPARAVESEAYRTLKRIVAGCTTLDTARRLSLNEIEEILSGIAPNTERAEV